VCVFTTFFDLSTRKARPLINKYTFVIDKPIRSTRVRIVSDALNSDEFRKTLSTNWLSGKGAPNLIKIDNRIENAM
jgi:hypothetical protein